ncbi:MAG: fumarylacetoacetate hydrolase family protein [Bacteroidota bacterium]
MNPVESKILEAAKILRDAQANKKLCNPIREIIGADNIEAAYAIQNLNTNLKLESGAQIIGKKIGLTSKVVQEQFGIDEPDFGMLWNDTEVENGGSIAVNEILQPRAEAELAFILKQDLNSENLTSLDVLMSIEYVLSSIEIVGSRIKNWDIRIADTIADNASASHWVIGHQPRKIHQVDILNCKMSMTKNGELVSSGIGSNCLGSPINATLWLAKQMAKLGQPLKAGELILSGAVGPMVAISAGDTFHCSIEGLGDVSCSFE